MDKYADAWCALTSDFSATSDDVYSFSWLNWYSVRNKNDHKLHLFMITSWNKIAINISDFDPEGEKLHPTPPPEDAIFARGNQNI